ncbi:MAG TPA: RseA family anti-sigma factor [Telluria sp.]|nr:RseA family anti-sigma factor [Telluria sp.]
MDTYKKMRELVSALADGEISDADLELAFAALLAPDGQLAWSSYHMIGDALREAGGAALSGDFAARLAARLDAEAPQGGRGAAPARTEPAPTQPEAAPPPASAIPDAAH